MYKFQYFKTKLESSIQIFREKVACVEESVERSHGKVNDLEQYIGQLDLHIVIFLSPFRE